jgi:hypothetical protein
VIAAVLATIAPLQATQAVNLVEVVFESTGTEQTFVVPPGVETIHVVLLGGRGGAGVTGGAGGAGARVEGDLSVTPGSTLYVEVASSGAAGVNGQGGVGGFNGGGSGGAGGPGSGGGGGGASDLRTISRTAADSLGSRRIVAGGGGGGGGGSSTGGDGGAAGVAGGSTAGATGGGAGTFVGGSGEGTWGPGRTGIGGDGTPDALGSGGGGGGGGAFGGGGGADSRLASGAAGGGGGSSFTGTVANVSVGTSSASDGKVTITYVGTTPDPTPGTTGNPDSGVVDADVTVPTSAACIQLSTSSITFGTQRFGGRDIESYPIGSIHLLNCSGSDATLLARGTDAIAGSATWNLVDDAGTCADGSLAIDDYHLKLRNGATDVVTSLSETSKTLRTLAGGGVGTFDPRLDMPCPGSAGAGETMGMQIVFVVTE